MNFTLPSDTIVYEEEPTAAANLIANQPTQYVPTMVWCHPNSRPPLNAACRKVPPLDNFAFAARTLIAPARAPIYFLHERQSPAGHRRLVTVTAGGSLTHLYNGPPRPILLWEGNYEVLIPSGLTTSDCEIAKYDEFNVGRTLWHAPQLRVYAGQPDPNDPAHFTIRYQMWGQEDVLDGRLNDDETITLSPRKPPVDPTK